MTDARTIIAEVIDAPWTDVPARTRHKLADRIIAALAKAGLEIRPKDAALLSALKAGLTYGDTCAGQAWAKSAGLVDTAASFTERGGAARAKILAAIATLEPAP